MGANTRFRSLSDYIRNKANVRAKCRCGHVGVVDAVKFKRWVAAHGDNEWLEVCGGRLRCIKCREKPVSIKPKEIVDGFEKYFGPKWTKILLGCLGAGLASASISAVGSYLIWPLLVALGVAPTQPLISQAAHTALAILQIISIFGMISIVLDARRKRHLVEDWEVNARNGEIMFEKLNSLRHEYLEMAESLRLFRADAEEVSNLNDMLFDDILEVARVSKFTEEQLQSFLQLRSKIREKIQSQLKNKELLEAPEQYSH